MNKKYKNVVIILAKKPTLGKTKTRIAKDTSDAFSLKLATASFEDLLNNLANSDYNDLIVGTDNSEDLRWFENQYHTSGITVNVPPDSNLSEKMKFVFNDLLNKYDYDKAILIPMDLPFIQSEEIISAFSRMDSSPFVLGPETNGGVYMIGMNKSAFAENLFDNVPWSTPHCFEALESNFERSKVHKLKLKDDINTFQDILVNKDQIKIYCPKLFDLLHKEGYYFDAANHFVDFDTLNICIPTVSAIIEREVKGSIEVLLQTRNKPSTDPIYSGKLEIPSGLIERYESACKAVVREVKEETGLDVEINNSFDTEYTYEGDKNDQVISYQSFCTSQQTRGGRSYLNIGFICTIKGEEMVLEENKYETKNPHWVKLDKLSNMLKETPTMFFATNVPILKKYIKSKKL